MNEQPRVLDIKHPMRPREFPQVVQRFDPELIGDVVEEFRDNPSRFIFRDLDRRSIPGDETKPLIAHLLKDVPREGQSLYVAGFLFMQRILDKHKDDTGEPTTIITLPTAHWLLDIKKNSPLESYLLLQFLGEQEELSLLVARAQKRFIKESGGNPNSQETSPSTFFADGLMDRYMLTRLSHPDRVFGILEGEYGQSRLRQRPATEVLAEPKHAVVLSREPEPVSAFVHAFARALEKMDDSGDI